jgi:hypothetical protein
MVERDLRISRESLAEIFLHPRWDPVPPWLKISDDVMRRFTALEIQFKIKELEIQQERLAALSEMMGPSKTMG